VKLETSPTVRRVIQNATWPLRVWLPNRLRWKLARLGNRRPYGAGFWTRRKQFFVCLQVFRSEADARLWLSERHTSGRLWDVVDLRTVDADVVYSGRPS
jgi:hypothetical protein